MQSRIIFNCKLSFPEGHSSGVDSWFFNSMKLEDWRAGQETLDFMKLYAGDEKEILTVTARYEVIATQGLFSTPQYLDVQEGPATKIFKRIQNQIDEFRAINNHIDFEGKTLFPELKR